MLKRGATAFPEAGSLLAAAAGAALAVWAAPAPVWLAVPLFAAAVLTPGWLLVRLAGVASGDRVLRTALSVPAGLLALVLLGLLLNTTLPLLGVQAPLARAVVIPAALVLTGLLWVAACGRQALAWWRLGRAGRVPFRRPAIRSPARPLLAAAALGLLPLTATAGAIALDNGGPATVTVLLLAVLLVLSGWLVLNAPRLPRPLLAAAIYAIALSLLLMTSMRGWTITGHDIQREFQVFQLTLQDDRWQISSMRDPYNACLSITVLPTVLAALTGAAPTILFKLLYQLLFAAVPVLVLGIAEPLVGRRRAVACSIYCFAFLTFFSDMPMLLRQEIAFLFAAAILYLLLAQPALSARRRGVLLVAAGLGTVLAHYSTTYLLLVQLLIAWALLALARPWRPRAVTLRILPLLGICLLAWLWSGPVTDTSGGAADTARSALAQVTGSGPVTASSDAKVGLLSRGSSDAQWTLDQYANDLADSAFSPDGLPRADWQQVRLLTAPEQVAARTALGDQLRQWGIDPFALNAATRLLSAQGLQLVVLAGVAALLLRARRPLPGREPPPAELIALSVAGLGVLALMVLLPVLTVDYGLLRAFQQLLFVLAIPAVLAGQGLPARWQRVAGPLTLALPLGLLFSSTGLMASLTGGYLPQLHLADAGENYQDYYLHPTDRDAAAWLAPRIGAAPLNSQLVADRGGGSWLVGLAPLASAGDVAPAAISRSGYVLLGWNTVRDGRVYTLYHNQGISYSYPAGWLDQLKSRVYDNGSARVYR